MLMLRPSDARTLEPHLRSYVDPMGAVQRSTAHPFVRGLKHD